MYATTTSLAGAAPAGLEAPCAYLGQVLNFHAAHGGPFPRSRELEHAVRRLARAWLAAGLAGRALASWLGLAAATAFGPGATARVLDCRLRAWAVDEWLLADGAAPLLPNVRGPSSGASSPHFGSR